MASHNDRAETLLRRLLSDGPKGSGEVRQAAREEGIYPNALYHVAAWRPGFRYVNGAHPTGSLWFLEPDPTPAPWRGWL